MCSTILGLCLALAAGDETEVPDVHPTLAEIFKPPRLLGVRPRDVSISADGQFVTWRWTATDAEQPQLDWWIAPADGHEPARVLFPASTTVDLQWAPRGQELLIRRAGWIERMDFAADGAARPLFEYGASASPLEFTRDGRRALFVAGASNELWVLDLEDGSRFAPASALVSRGRWFQLLDGLNTVALFAAPPGAVPPAAVEAPPPPAPEVRGDGRREGRGDRRGEGRDEARPDGVKRVLWFVPLDPGASPRATKLEEGDPIEISADGRFVLLTKSERETRRELIVPDFLTEAVTATPARSSLAGDLAAPRSLTLWDVEKEQRFEPPLDEGSRFILLDTRWSPTGARLLVHRLSGDFHSRQILVLDAQERRSWPLHAERDDAWIGGPAEFAAWGRDGTTVLFSSEQSGWCHVYAVPSGGGEVRTLTSGDFEVQEFRPLEDGARALLVANERDRAEKTLVLLDLESGERRALSAAGACVDEAFAASRDGSAVAYLQEELGVPADVHAVALDGGEPRRLSDAVPAALRELALPPPEVVDFANAADGTALRALLYRPEPFDARRVGPAVVFIHGAGYLQNVTRSMTAYPPNMLFHHRLARMGFTVLDVDYRHSAGYGRKFRTDVYGFMGGKDLDDEVAGVEYLKTLGFVDTGRVGVYGGSYGGFLTLMALFTKPDVFACGAALRSVTDWRTYTAWYTNARLGDPKKDAENYRRSSPIDHAEGLKKPLLLLHGMKDGNVFAQDTIRLIEKLIQLGKDFDAMLYPSQDHTFTDPESWIDEYRRIERLFQRELKPGRREILPGSTSGVSTLPRPL
jgi:dipeptidyl aminopeptidase/acylaminoacyl peptidase